MGKIFLVVLGFFILTLVMLIAKKVIGTIRKNLSDDPLRDFETNKIVKKFCSLRFQIMELDCDMIATVSCYLGIITSMAGILYIALLV